MTGRTEGPARPLRVVHVITSLTTGGAERQLEMLVRRSAHESVTIALYAGGPVADSMRAAGERVEVLDLVGWRRALTSVVLARRLRHYRPDVVHVHLLSAQLWGIPAARLAGVPVVVSTEHSLMDDTIEGRPHTWWLRLLYRGLERLATHTVAVSSTTAQRLRRWGVQGTRITVADNGIDFEALAFDEVRDTLHQAMALGGADILAYGPVEGLGSLRRAIAARMARCGAAVAAAEVTCAGQLVPEGQARTTAPDSLTMSMYQGVGPTSRAVVAVSPTAVPGAVAAALAVSSVTRTSGAPSTDSQVARAFSTPGMAKGSREVARSRKRGRRRPDTPWAAAARRRSRSRSSGTSGTATTTPSTSRAASRSARR